VLLKISTEVISLSTEIDLLFRTFTIQSTTWLVQTAAVKMGLLGDAKTMELAALAGVVN
jgi:hypothetical protein